MDQFNNIDYQKGDNENINTITVGAGVRLLNLANENSKNNVSIPIGVCAGVAAGGHFQSSSQSLVSRSFGLGLDYVTHVKIITADGQIRHLYRDSDNSDDKDLFWA